MLLIKMFLGLVEMAFGIVYASFSLPEWQAVKMIFFAPCVAWVEKDIGLDYSVSTDFALVYNKS